jgi:hypothetical protein
MVGVRTSVTGTSGRFSSVNVQAATRFAPVA